MSVSWSSATLNTKCSWKTKFRVTYYFWMDFGDGEGKEMPPLKWSVRLKWLSTGEGQTGWCCLCVSVCVCSAN